ncbi:MAG TPA: radical SAM protein [Aquificaceae bacterium]|nr:radical SAM protein [Aquificaceae bacterium]
MGLKFSAYAYSTKDVPGKWSLVLFLPFCNFMCRHCHNWRLVLGREKNNISEEFIIEEIKKNPFIECIVISGGEPTVHKTEHLSSFIKKIKEVKPELSIRIDTNGYNPGALDKLRDFVEGFALDIKAPIQDDKLYSYTTNVKVDTKKIIESIHIADGLPLTLFRTVNYPWLREEDINAIRGFTKKLKSPWQLNDFYEVPDCPFNLR